VCPFLFSFTNIIALFSLQTKFFFVHRQNGKATINSHTHKWGSRDSNPGHGVRPYNFGNFLSVWARTYGLKQSILITEIWFIYLINQLCYTDFLVGSNFRFINVGLFNLVTNCDHLLDIIREVVWIEDLVIVLYILFILLFIYTF
jgi:IS4 transposase